MTMASGFEACTFGKLKFTSDSTVDSDKLSAPGVLDVKIGIHLPDATQSNVRTAVLNAARSKLGFRLPGQFDHVMIIVEKCYEVQTSCSFAAVSCIVCLYGLFVLYHHCCLVSDLSIHFLSCFCSHVVIYFFHSMPTSTIGYHYTSRRITCTLPSACMRLDIIST